MVTDRNPYSFTQPIISRTFQKLLTRQEKERLIVELYNQGKTIRDIAKELRISFRDIGAILKKTSGEKEEKQDKEKSPSSQAYQLFAEGKEPIEIAIALNLTESETTRFYEEYQNLKNMQELRIIYKEIGDDIVQFLKLFRLSKKERFNVQHIVTLLRIANNDLPALERRYHRLKKDMVLLELEKQNSEQIGSDVRILAKMSEDYKKQIEGLRRKKIALEDLIEESKNKEEYKRIISIVEQEVNNRLSERRDLLKIAIAIVLESIRQDPDKYRFLINSNQYYSGQYAISHPFIDGYRNLILDEAQKLFELIERDLPSKIVNEPTHLVKNQPS